MIINDSWNIQKEKHLNPNNIIFKDIAYVKLYQTMKKVDDKLKEKKEKPFTMREYAKKIYNLNRDKDLFKHKKRDK